MGATLLLCSNSWLGRNDGDGQDFEQSYHQPSPSPNPRTLSRSPEASRQPLRAAGSHNHDHLPWPARNAVSPRVDIHNEMASSTNRPTDPPAIVDESQNVTSILGSEQGPARRRTALSPISEGTRKQVVTESHGGPVDLTDDPAKQTTDEPTMTGVSKITPSSSSLASQPVSSALSAADLEGLLATLLPATKLSGSTLDFVIRAIRPALDNDTRVYSNTVLDTDTAREPCDESCRRILIPVYHDDISHWTLGEADFQERKVRFYDPLGPKVSESATAKFTRFMKALQIAVDEQWTMDCMESALQVNGYDCGVHTLVNLLQRICDIPVRSRKFDGASWRLILRSFTSGIIQKSETDSSLPTQEKMAPSAATTSEELFQQIPAQFKTIRASFTRLNSELQRCIESEEDIDSALSTLRKLQDRVPLTLGNEDAKELESLKTEEKKMQTILDDLASLTQIPGAGKQDMISSISKHHTSLETRIRQVEKRHNERQCLQERLAAAVATASALKGSRTMEITRLKEEMMKASQDMASLAARTGHLSVLMQSAAS